MAEKRKFVVEYSSQSLKNATEIISYLQRKFSQKEIDNFYKTLNDFENIIHLFPTLYAESKKVKIRKAVLSKVLSVYYKLMKNKVVIIAILDNRWEESNRI
jgi:hypothetical protein